MPKRSASVDARALRSRAALLEAAREFIGVTPLTKVSTTMIATRAGVSRQTFYQHFLDADDALFCAVMDAVERRHDAHVADEPDGPLVEILQFAIDHAHWFEAVNGSRISAQLDERFGTLLTPALTQLVPDLEPGSPRCVFLIGGTLRLIDAWSRNPHSFDLIAATREQIAAR